MDQQPATSPRRAVSPRRLWIKPTTLAAAEKVQAMLALCADVEYADTDGWTLLHSLAAAGDARNLKTVLDMKASATARTHDGRTAMQITSSAECAEILSDAGRT